MTDADMWHITRAAALLYAATSDKTAPPATRPVDSPPPAPASDPGVASGCACPCGMLPGHTCTGLAARAVPVVSGGFRRTVDYVPMCEACRAANTVAGRVAAE